MNEHLSSSAQARLSELVATFGDAQIVKHLDGRLEIRGGSDEDKFRAHDWMKKFLTTTPLTVQRLR